MDLTRMRSLFTCEGCNEQSCAAGKNSVWKKRMKEDLTLSVCESPPNAQTISLTFYLFPEVYVRVNAYIYVCSGEKDYAVCACCM